MTEIKKILGRPRKEHTCYPVWKFPRIHVENKIDEEAIKELVAPSESWAYCLESEVDGRPHYHVYLKVCQCHYDSWKIKHGLKGNGEISNRPVGPTEGDVARIISYCMKQYKYVLHNISPEMTAYCEQNNKEHRAKETFSHYRGLKKLLEGVNKNDKIVEIILKYFKDADCVMGYNQMENYIQTFIFKQGGTEFPKKMLEKYTNVAIIEKIRLAGIE